MQPLEIVAMKGSEMKCYAHSLLELQLMLQLLW